jgi:hypothetical protein
MCPKRESAHRKERRRKPRIERPFPAIVRGVDIDGTPFEITTKLDNISASGLYMRLTPRLQPNAELSIIARLSLSLVAGDGAVVALRGRVVRTDSQAVGGFGVAVEVKQREFL